MTNKRSPKDDLRSDVEDEDLRDAVHHNRVCKHKEGQKDERRSADP